MISQLFLLLPKNIQRELRRFRYGIQIRQKSFKSNEIEYSLLDDWINPGDWVLDIGASVGYYSLKLSGLVGKTGRVLAFEPVPSTVDLLTSNVSRAPYENITTFNVAVSYQTDLVGIVIPENFPREKYYRAHISSNSPTALSVLSISIDSLDISHPVRLAKIDVEGHEIHVLRGMENLLKRDHPILIVEGVSSEVNNYLSSLGYVGKRVGASANQVFRPLNLVD
jgi:FkbM family methyltransferase